MEESLSEAAANSPATADVKVSGAVVGAILDILSQTGSRMLPLCCILIGRNEPFVSSFSKTTTAGDKVPACSMNHHLGFPEEEIAHFLFTFKGVFILASLAMKLLTECVADLCPPDPPHSTHHMPLCDKTT